MKNKLLVIILSTLFAALTVSCGTEKSNDSAVATLEKLESTEAEETVEETSMEDAEGVSEQTVTQQEDTDDEEFTFADLAELRFEFSSGTGGWFEGFRIERDGYFVGQYSCFDTQDVGEDYPDGTIYSSIYTGHFTDITRINDYTYQMKLADITYKEPVDSVEIDDGIRVINRASYCLGDNDTFTIYLQGTPLDDISDEVCRWINWMNESQMELTMSVIADETNGYGMYSRPRMDPFEYAEMEYSSYKKSYDYYCNLISEAETTVEMLEYNMEAYELSDYCLNYIWDILRYNVEEDKFAEILEEQRAWIQKKEVAAEEARAEFGGSFAEVIYYDTLAEYTINRCAELVEHLRPIDELTFADLSKRKFGFSGGAGAWLEEFTIERDGYFTGYFQNSDIGDIGEEYADGTLYKNSYSGHFTNLTKINDHTYQMTLTDISYRYNVGREAIWKDIRYVYTDSYCLGGNDTFTLYLQGTPLSELSDEVYSWISMVNQSEVELTMPIIVDEANYYGMYSHERLEPLEDAQQTYKNARESFDYYGDKIGETVITADWVGYTGTMYGIADDCLNYIWNLIRYNVEEDEYAVILEEQRAWIEEKEKRADEAASEYGMGSFAAVSHNDVLAHLTMERCEELIEYLK